MVRTKFDARLVDETRFRHDLEECRGTPDGESLKIEKKGYWSGVFPELGVVKMSFFMEYLQNKIIENMEDPKEREMQWEKRLRAAKASAEEAYVCLLPFVIL